MSAMRLRCQLKGHPHASVLEPDLGPVRAYISPVYTRRGSLAGAEMLSSTASLILSTDKAVLASLEQKLRKVDEACRIEESRRVDLELSIMDVKDNLKKAEAGPVTLGTTVDTTHLDNVSPRVSAGHWGS